MASKLAKRGGRSMTSTAYRHLYKGLQGPAHLKARKLYKALIRHLNEESCMRCTSYTKYSCIIIRGDIWQHITDIADFPIVPDDLFKLKEAGLVELEEITAREHRITFVSPEREEEVS
jgi:hypothetical protein